VGAYVHPVPRLDVSRALAGPGVVRGAIDVSDGLSSDLIHLCESNDLGCEIHAHALPLARGVRAFCRQRHLDPVEWALHSGEDYALVLAIPRRRIAAACRAIQGTGVHAAIIGRFTRERGSYRIIESTSRSRAFRRGGWDHLKKSSR
jgi:thiamine-monophosphate kinase